jgi:hypothetical protein
MTELLEHGIFGAGVSGGGWPVHLVASVVSAVAAMSCCLYAKSSKLGSMHFVNNWRASGDGTRRCRDLGGVS